MLSFSPLELYLADLEDLGNLIGPYLPPTPPLGLEPPDRGIAWAAWWEASDQQRAMGIKGKPHALPD